MYRSEQTVLVLVLVLAHIYIYVHDDDGAKRSEKLVASYIITSIKTRQDKSLT